MLVSAIGDGMSVVGVVWLRRASPGGPWSCSLPATVGAAAPARLVRRLPAMALVTVGATLAALVIADI
jgi:hypothetical protein